MRTARTTRTARTLRTDRPGFSLVEAIIAILVVAVMLTAALNTIGAASIGRFRTSRRATAQRLAAQLVDEIMQLPYEDPDGGGLTIGRESGETNGSLRDRFDDVDDYNFWTDDPIRDKAGNVLPGLTGWTRFVDVDLIDASNLDGHSASDVGIKRITVIVRYKNKDLARINALRTRATDDVQPEN